MRTNTIFVLGAVALALMVPAMAIAQVPGQIPIQGFLTDDEDEPLEGEFEIRFTLYNAAEDGLELYTELQTVAVDRGVFTAALGSAGDLDLGLFQDSSEVFLGIQVGDDSEASPRLHFGTVPYAAVSEMTNSFGGVSAADFPSTVEELARGVCLDTTEELTTLLDDSYLSIDWVPSWGDIAGIPADIADGDDGFTSEGELTALLDDNYSVRDHAHGWAEILDIPEGFADGVDDGFTTEFELTALLDDDYAARYHAHGWAEILDIPEGFADGVDNGITSEGELTAILDDHYRPIEWVPSWGDITDIPADIADGDNVRAAGAGLALDGDTLSVHFDGVGVEDVAARADTVSELATLVSALQERIEDLEAAQPQGIPYRWVLFSTYDQHGGAWAFNNRSEMFGGVTPQNWTDGNFRPVNMSPNADILRTLLHRRGYAWPTTNMISRNFRTYSSTTGWVYICMFRIRNDTDDVITWQPRFYVTAYGGWNEYAGVAVNGVEVWQSGGTWYAADFNTQVDINLPPGQVSTVIFSSTTAPASGDLRFLQFGFVDDTLDLPTGLVAIDDLDTLEGDLW